MGAGVWVWGPNTVPLACMPCGGCVPLGWWGAISGGGWPATITRGVWCQALSLPRPPVLWSGQPGLCDPCVPGAVGAGVGTQPRPHSVRPCGPALLTMGASVVRHSPYPDCPPSGRAVGIRHPHAVGAGVWLWGPNTVPLACMPCGPVSPRYWSYTPYSGTILVGERYCYWLKPPRRTTTPTRTIYWGVLKIKLWVLMTLL